MAKQKIRLQQKYKEAILSDRELINLLYEKRKGTVLHTSIRAAANRDAQYLTQEWATDVIKKHFGLSKSTIIYEEYTK